MPLPNTEASVQHGRYSADTITTRTGLKFMVLDKDTDTLAVIEFKAAYERASVDVILRRNTLPVENGQHVYTGIEAPRISTAEYERRVASYKDRWNVYPPSPPVEYELVLCALRTFEDTREAAVFAAGPGPAYTFEADKALKLAPFEKVVVDTRYGEQWATVLALHPPRPTMPLKRVLRRA
jgi:hypothetical protein